jgi:hypothetical protein
MILSSFVIGAFFVGPISLAAFQMLTVGILLLGVFGTLLTGLGINAGAKWSEISTAVCALVGIVSAAVGALLTPIIKIRSSLYIGIVSIVVSSSCSL